MKNAAIILGICLLLVLPGNGVLSASRQQRLVARVDTATVVLKGKTLTIHATGMGRTPGALGRGGWLVPRRPGVLNKDGLLEYDMVFGGKPDYTGFKLKPVKASHRERSVPPGVRGVRIFSEFNEKDALLPETKPEKKPLLPFGKKREKVDKGEAAGSITGGTPTPAPR
ncbi:MAG TPA: hypothetical protein VJ719_12880 [Chthoniobacterales bacterium]|nr:hypothetical protein [Chthoniobacterales bacterium]